MTERCGECGEAVNPGFRVCPSCGAHRGSRIKAILTGVMFWFIAVFAFAVASQTTWKFLYFVAIGAAFLGFFGFWMAKTGYWEKTDS